MAESPFDQNLPFETGESLPLVANASVNVVNSANLVGVEKLGELHGGPSSNESENEEAAGPSGGATGESNRSNSPPPNCAICLSRCKDKCFTESCAHQFCFKCLCEWSKIKPECPLCKQAFKSIIHNVRAMGEFDRYHVQPNPQMPERPLTARFLWSDRPNVVVPQLRHPIIVNEPVMRNGAIEGDSARNMNSRYEPYRVELLNMYRQDRANGGTIIGSLSQLWRRYIYDRKLYALPVSDMVTGQFRDWSARFYRSHPAQIHRLMPWINRDIVCLLRNTTHSVTEVMTLMGNILPLSNILGPTFRRQLSPFLGNQTSHFIHELFNFARSPYDMIGYDRVVQYSAQVAEEVTIDFTSSSDDERQENNNNNSEDTNAASNVSNNNSTNNRTEQQRSHWTGTVIVNNPNAGATHSLSVSLSTDGLVLPIRGSAIQSTAMNLSIHSRDDDVIEIEDNEFDADAAANAEVAAINNSSSNSSSNQSRRHAGAEMPVTLHIELNSSDSDTASEINSNNSSGESSDCEFVLERKAPHLRTPELVSLNSDSDSDCVIVDEVKPSVKKDITKEKENGEQIKVDGNEEPNLFMGASTSTGVCSNSGNNWREKYIDELVKKQSMKRTSSKRGGGGRRAHTRAEAQRKRKKASPFRPDTSSSSSDSSDSDSSFSVPSSSSDSETNERRKRRMSTRLSEGQRTLRSENNKKSIETEKRQKEQNEQKVMTRKRRSMGKNKYNINEKRCKREEIFSNDEDDAFTSDSDHYKESLREYRAQQKLEKCKFYRQIDHTTTSDDSSSSISETSTGAMSWLKTELIDPTSADADLPIAGTTNSTQETLPLAECVDENRTVAASSRLSSSGSSSSSPTDSNSSSVSFNSSSNSSSVPEAQNRNDDKDDDDGNDEIEVNRSDASFNDDNERINESVLNFSTDSMVQHGDDDSDNDHDHDRSTEFNHNTSSSRNSHSDDDNDENDNNGKNYNNDTDNESHHDVNDDDDDDNYGNGDEDDENDRSILNLPNTSAGSFGNLLEEESRLPIYSDVSTDTSPPTQNRDIGEDAETADIDVGGMDSFY